MFIENFSDLIFLYPIMSERAWYHWNDANPYEGNSIVICKIATVVDSLYESLSRTMKLRGVHKWPLLLISCGLDPTFVSSPTSCQSTSVVKADVQLFTNEAVASVIL